MTTPDESGDRPLLEVVCSHLRDVPGATRGGADRILLLADPESGGRTPEPTEVSAVCKETDVPVRVLLRGESDAAPVDQASADWLLERARQLLTLGATSVALGFLDDQLEIDVASTGGLARVLGVPWGFHRGFDAALSADHAWRAVRALPGLDSVTTGGSARGLASGGEDVVRRAAADPAVARVVLAAGGLVPDQVPWLVRSGVRRLQLGAEARADGSWQRAYVDAGRVRAWRMLLDDACDRADGVVPWTPVSG